MMDEANAFRLDPDAVAHSIVKLPSLPVIVLDLLHSIEDENASAEMLSAKVASDPALVARLLRVANSSFYGLQRKVSSVSDAIFVLGLGSVRNMALSATLYESMNSQIDPACFNFKKHWRHSMATALCAEALAVKMKCARDSAFAAGLLHDIGQLILPICFPKHQEAVLKYCVQFDCSAYVAERALLDADHAAIGRVLTEKWNFPPTLSEAVGWHHEPENAAGAAPLAGVLHLADCIVHGLDLVDNPSEQVPRINANCWNQANLSWADSQALFSKVESGLEALCCELAI
jgi:putative nucleotidyltransferase with HDIG domain